MQKKINNMKYKVVENKTANIIGNIGLIIFLSAFLVAGVSVVVGILYNREVVAFGVGYFLLSLPITLVFIMVASSFSTRDEDTRIFLNEIRKELKLAKSIPDLTIVRDKLIKESIDKNNMIRISFPSSVKELIKEIDYKIEILEINKK